MALVGGVVAASVVGAMQLVQRSPDLLEWFTGADVASAVSEEHATIQARKGDRLTMPDAGEMMARTDVAELQRLGRPSVEAVWAARMTLPSPAEWVRQSSPPAPVDPTAPLAYSAATATAQPREAVQAIEESVPNTIERPPEQSLAAIPLPTPRPEVPESEEEEEDEAEVVPLPLPRPRNIPAQVAAAPPLPPPNPRGGPVSLMPPAPGTTVPGGPATAGGASSGAPQAVAAPTPAAVAPSPATTASIPRRPMRDEPAMQDDGSPMRDGPAAPSFVTPAAPATTAAPGTPQQPRVQLASLGGAPERQPEAAPRQQQPSIMTPFGVPFTLQQASVETNCFPPQLVDLLRRIERSYGRRPIVTSGYRGRGRSGSLHRRCMAADIIVQGVSADSLARAARGVPGMGGVGIYCHQNMIHVDIGTPRDWRYGCGSFFAMRDGSVARGRVPAELARQE